MLDELSRVAYKGRVKGRWIWIILVLLALDIAVFMWWRTQQRENAFDAQIQQAASAYGIAPELIKAVVWRESKFNPDARGSSGEYGLMQIQETAANEWAAAMKNNDFKPEHLLNPKTNLLAGAWYLSKWSNRAPHTDDPRPFALAAYNAGPTKAREWSKDTNSSSEFIKLIDYQATKNYVLSVQRKTHHYRSSFK
jgi:soluble lytic murein transglycosylase